jgi:hypothetical protein
LIEAWSLRQEASQESLKKNSLILTWRMYEMISCEGPRRSYGHATVEHVQCVGMYSTRSARTSSWSDTLSRCGKTRSATSTGRSCRFRFCQSSSPPLGRFNKYYTPASQQRLGVSPNRFAPGQPNLVPFVKRCTMGEGSSKREHAGPARRACLACRTVSGAWATSSCTLTQDSGQGEMLGRLQ